MLWFALYMNLCPSNTTLLCSPYSLKMHLEMPISYIRHSLEVTLYPLPNIQILTLVEGSNNVIIQTMNITEWISKCQYAHKQKGTNINFPCTVPPHRKLKSWSPATVPIRTLLNCPAHKISCVNKIYQLRSSFPSGFYTIIFHLIYWKTSQPLLIS